MHGYGKAAGCYNSAFATAAGFIVRQLPLDLALPPAPTLDNFVAGSNLEAMMAVVSLLQPDPPERAVYLWGPAGAGKTHLLYALAGAAGLAGWRAAYLDARTAELPESLFAPDIVLIDHIDTLTPAGQITLFSLYNERIVGGGGRLVTAGPVPPRQLALREDLRTRLGAGLVLQLAVLTDAEKISALQAHAASRQFDLPLDVCHYLLTRGPRDLPRLLAVLDALDEQTLIQQRLVTVPLVRTVLAHWNLPHEPTGTI